MPVSTPAAQVRLIASQILCMPSVSVASPVSNAQSGKVLPMTSSQLIHSHEAVGRATQGQSVMNYPSIFEGFMAKGIELADIKPRENVFTFWAWKALGRQVKKGEHGVKSVTFIPVSGKADATTGESKGFRMPRTVTVFHISQTEEVR